LFYDGSAAAVAVAKAVCVRCGVRQQCLAEALAEEADGKPFGVRRGLEAHERLVLLELRPSSVAG
jgi:hypothetical protein